MTDSSEARASTAENARIGSLDVLRGFALMGILVMNIQSFSMPPSAYFIPNTYGSLEGANGWVWFMGAVGFEYKFMAIFSMLFGAGVVLMSQRRDAAGLPSTGLHYRRMLLLMMFGLIHAYLIWPGDILFAYSICGMVVFWVRGWQPRTLAILGGLLITLGSTLHVFSGVGAMFSEEVREAMRADLVPSAEEIEDTVAAFQGSYFDHFPIQVEEAFGLHIFVLPALLFWRISGLMLIGMALFKWSVLSAERPIRFYAWLAAIGGGIGLPLATYGALALWRADFEASFVFGLGALPNWFGSVGIALAWISLVMPMCKASGFSAIKQGLSAYGRMAFTNYIGQSLLATCVFYGYGLGWFGQLERVEQVGVCIAIWTVQIVFSVVWLRYFRIGPLEWVWRSGVYVKLQPLRR